GGPGASESTSRVSDQLPGAGGRSTMSVDTGLRLHGYRKVISLLASEIRQRRVYRGFPQRQASPRKKLRRVGEAVTPACRSIGVPARTRDTAPASTHPRRTHTLGSPRRAGSAGGRAAAVRRERSSRGPAGRVRPRTV